MGTVSGKDEDKIAKSNLSLEKTKILLTLRKLILSLYVKNYLINP